MAIVYSRFTLIAAITLFVFVVISVFILVLVCAIPGQMSQDHRSYSFKASSHFQSARGSIVRTSAENQQATYRWESNRNSVPLPRAQEHLSQLPYQSIFNNRTTLRV